MSLEKTPLTPFPPHEGLERQVDAFTANLSALTHDSRKVGHTVGFDIFQLPHWPRPELTTFVTAGFSALLMPTAEDGFMGHELALSFSGDAQPVEPSGFLESFGDYLLERRLAVADRELFPIAEDEASPIELASVYIRIGYLLPPSIDRFYKTIPVTVLELFLIDKAGTELARQSPGDFTRQFDQGAVMPLNWANRDVLS